VAHCQPSPGARTPLDQARCLTTPRTNPTLPLTRVCLCVVVCECARGVESGGGARLQILLMLWYGGGCCPCYLLSACCLTVYSDRGGCA